jgi:LuxR family maltose regulon positive regulatory protein
VPEEQKERGSQGPQGEATPLLRTKICLPPVPPELVSRPRLIDHLNRGLHRKLTLMVAPAGFGKTTLLSDALRNAQTPVAWLSVDEDDNDPVHFWTYFIAALQAAQRS